MEENKPTIILVEDDPDVGPVIQAVLEDIFGVTVIHYDDARTARECLGSLKATPRLIISDLMMPGGVTGFDFLYQYADKMSPLGNAGSDDCANYIVSMFSDYTRMVTMQNLFQPVKHSNGKPEYQQHFDVFLQYITHIMG